MRPTRDHNVVAARLRAAFADAATYPGDPAPAHARALLLAEVLERVREALAAVATPVVMVKGAGLAYTVYDAPWHRPMSDVDLLVDEAQIDAVVDALQAHGFRAAAPPPRRPLTERALGERQLALRIGGALFPVEVHPRLDKLVPRPVDEQGILARATPVSGLEPLRAPAPEDHFLLVVLHLASSDFSHDVGWLDLFRLLPTENASAKRLVTRARAWALATPTWMALVTLRALGASVDDALIGALEPPAWRRRAIAPWFSPGSFPVKRHLVHLGPSWVVRQTSMRDDLDNWLLGLSTYGAKRLVEYAYGLVTPAPPNRVISPPR